ncbi:MAG: hypothetical protein LAT67_09035 [Balneolales bacterium]|nr:hypothetical protein [Balneolales bacterium]
MKTLKFSNFFLLGFALLSAWLSDPFHEQLKDEATVESDIVVQISTNRSINECLMEYGLTQNTDVSSERISVLPRSIEQQEQYSEPALFIVQFDL